VSGASAAVAACGMSGMLVVFVTSANAAGDSAAG
jgi:hypothetical protein